MLVCLGIWFCVVCEIITGTLGFVNPLGMILEDRTLRVLESWWGQRWGTTRL